MSAEHRITCDGGIIAFPLIKLFGGECTASTTFREVVFLMKNESAGCKIIIATCMDTIREVDDKLEDVKSRGGDPLLEFPEQTKRGLVVSKYFTSKYVEYAVRENMPLCETMVYVLNLKGEVEIKLTSRVSKPIEPQADEEKVVTKGRGRGRRGYN